MGSETGGRKCDVRSRFCARKRSVAAAADRAAYPRWGRHGKSLPAARAEPLRARVTGRDGARFGRGRVGEMAEESGEEGKRKRRTLLRRSILRSKTAKDDGYGGQAPNVQR